MDKRQVLDKIETSPNFPKIPRELSDIITMLQEPTKVEIDDLVDKIITVENLEDMIIEYINSEYFKLKRKLNSLKEAIIYLGISTMQVIIIATISSNLFPAKLNDSKKISYLKHTIGTAAASCAIAESIGGYDRYEIFSYGLLHDIGVVVIDNCCPELMEDILEIMKRGNHQIVAEKIVLGGLTHSDIGAWLCTKLNLPSNISNVIKNHHWPSKTEENNSVIDLIYMGDFISTRYYETLLEINLLIKQNLIMKNPLNISNELIDEISNSLPEEVDKVIPLFKRF